MERLCTAQDRLEACTLQSTLLEHGIDAAVHGEALDAVRGGLLPATLGGAISLWVRREDLEPALKVLEQIQQQHEPDRQPWRCAGCGEQHQGQFSSCWNCGQDRHTAPTEPIPVLPFDGRLDYERADPVELDQEVGPPPDWDDRWEGARPSFACARCGRVDNREAIRFCPSCGAVAGQAV
jgi:hypothetical protein